MVTFLCPWCGEMTLVAIHAIHSDQRWFWQCLACGYCGSVVSSAPWPPIEYDPAGPGREIWERKRRQIEDGERQE